MKLHSGVLVEFAKRFERSAGGCHGRGQVDFQPDFEDVLRTAGCAEGEARDLAERQLRAAADADIVKLEYDRERAHTTILKIRLAPGKEQALFAFLGRQSPSDCRKQWAMLFEEASSWSVPSQYGDSWRIFCIRRADACRQWRNMKPFKRADIEDGRELLSLLSRLLAWEGRHLVRWASSVLCSDSKVLERRQQVLERLLSEATTRAISGYRDLGILPVPPDVTFHGPVRLRIEDRWRDFRGLRGPVILSGADAEQITALECDATRCLTIENATPFRSLAGLASGELLIHSSYPNAATLTFLTRLAEHQANIEFWHFGDTDPSGFDILRDLRTRSGLQFRAFQMQFRPLPGASLVSRRERELLLDLSSKMPTERPVLEAILISGYKGDFEQERLGPPTLDRWPFY
jgi:Uncharacterized protein conserved in bacteria C-term(DUF2220)